ncbi:MAG TPA: hypothetical protein VFD06_03995 [Candidatus Polarisedimenticolia bacterium]|nr:hypothetical protein [Candidatus Polarisedimenticolia bacterium]
MLRDKGTGSGLLLFVLAAVFAVAFGPGPAFGDRPPDGAAATTPVLSIPEDPASTPVGSAEESLLPPLEGGFCPAVGPEDTDRFEVAPKPKFRTCRCSCGAPCRTNEDCGPGGICSAGITCC